MSGDRSWMDNRRNPNRRGITIEFVEGLEHFVEFARSHPQYIQDGKIRCPCKRCKNKKIHSYGFVKKHLMDVGFIDGYKIWVAHGEHYLVETIVQNHPTIERDQARELEQLVDEIEPSVGMDDMVRNAAGPEFDWTPNPTEDPNPDAKKFMNLMNSANEKVHPGAKATVLESVAEFLNIMADSNMSQQTYNRVMAAVQRLLPEENKMVTNFYDTKKLLGHIGLGYDKIDACKNQCMLFYKENEGLNSCSICGLSRYKPARRGSAKHKKNVPRAQLRYMPLIPRLQRIFSSKDTSEAMRWHKECPREEGVMTHPSDGEAWKHFDATYPDFAADARNIRLGICTDGFSPFGPGAKSYSCWPVIVTVYNLPPWLCMTDPYMYLSLFIPGPWNPGKNVDVYLRPLMDELKQLWNDGVQTWDAFKLQNFNMRAAVMWTINDFPAYGMLSGWSTHGRLACPYCMENTDAFRLEHYKKQCWFDCHRRFLPSNHPFRRQKNAFTKNRVELRGPPPHLNGEEIFERVSELSDVRWGKKFSKDRLDGFGKDHNWIKKSIFWELPYWKTNLIRHNLDVMHIEKNVFDNVFNTVMDFKSTTKDTPNGRLDLEAICNRVNLNIVQVNGKDYKPVAPFVLSREDKQRVLQWLKDLKLPDGYASNIGNCVNVEEGTIYGLKSHDCHVLLDRLLPIAFRDILPNEIWVALTELSEFFRAFTSSNLRVDDMKKLEESIVVTICKLEKIFPPSFFDSMEHLPIHLAYEARVGGPVQYRWMYPFERFLGKLKKKMSNRAKVEASISESVIIDEIVSFVSTYFHPNIETRFTKVGRNYDGGVTNTDGKISVFSSPGRFLGKKRTRMLSREEFEAARLYVLLNCNEVEDYLNMFEDQARDLAQDLIAIRTDNEFPEWFNKYILNNRGDAKAARLEMLAHGPLFKVNVYKGYFVNGYVFNTEEYGQTKTTWNSGVNLKGNLDYYGILQEVVELQYYHGNSVVLFNCGWRDAEQGIVKHGTFDLVDVKHSSKHRGNDVFILASQAQQVYMTPYPRRCREFSGWWAVWKTKARSTYNLPLHATTSSSTIDSSLHDCYQEEEMPTPPIISLNDNGEDEAFRGENTRAELEEVNLNETEFDDEEDEEGEGYADGVVDEDEDKESGDEEIEFCDTENDSEEENDSSDNE